jgi:hypothetical protein
MRQVTRAFSITAGHGPFRMSFVALVLDPAAVSRFWFWVLV